MNPWPHDRTLHAWWVTPDLLAGEYPGDLDASATQAKVGLLSGAGITMIVDLTTPDDHLLPYADHLPATIRRVAFPIPDRGVIDDAGYDAILRAVHDEIATGGRVYLHCWGGVGRTCTVVACFLGDEGRSLEETLEHITALRAGTRKSRRRFQESDAQRDLVRRRFAAR